jgi:hypothetical protein
MPAPGHGAGREAADIGQPCPSRSWPPPSGPRRHQPTSWTAWRLRGVKLVIAGDRTGRCRDYLPVDVSSPKQRAQIALTDPLQRVNCTGRPIKSRPVDGRRSSRRSGTLRPRASGFPGLRPRGSSRCGARDGPEVQDCRHAPGCHRAAASPSQSHPARPCARAPPWRMAGGAVGRECPLARCHREFRTKQACR